MTVRSAIISLQYIHREAVKQAHRPLSVRYSALRQLFEFLISIWTKKRFINKIYKMTQNWAINIYLHRYLTLIKPTAAATATVTAMIAITVEQIVRKQN